MSIIKVNQVTSVNESDRVSFPTGVNLGSISATDINASGVTTTTNLNVGTGITANNGNINLTGIVTASSFVGDGSGLTNINVYSQGEFNTGISTAVVYEVPTTPGVAYSVSNALPASTKYVVHSVHVTNVGNSDVSATAYAYDGEFSIGYGIPLPQRSSVELLRAPKVLVPGDYIKIGASQSSTLKAIITAEKIQDANGDFFGDGVTLVSSDTYYDVFSATNSSMIKSLLISNKDDNFDSRVTVVLTDSGDAVLSYYSFELIVPANSTIELFETDKFVYAGYKIRAAATTGNNIDVTVSGRRVYNLG